MMREERREVLGDVNLAKGEKGQMKKFIRSMFGVGIVFLTFSGGSSSFGAVAFSDNFNSYVTSSNLVGQGGWLQTGATATTPIQVVTPGRAQLGTSGQDVYEVFGSPTVNADGTSLYYGLTLNVISAQAAGDYFIHLTDPVGGSSLFYNRLYVKSSGAGFLLGFAETSGTGFTTNYGSTVFSTATDYQIVVAQHFIAGAGNDTFSVYVNPTDAVELNNTAEITKTWGTASTETNIYYEISLRQGAAGGAPAVYVDNLIVSQTFSDMVIPEPSTIALVGIGVAGLFAVRRRRS